MAVWNRLMECTSCGVLATDIAARTLGWSWAGSGICCHRCAAAVNQDAGPALDHGGQSPPIGTSGFHRVLRPDGDSRSARHPRG
jgi:hypothetical protein